ncbi:MAG: heat-inducible transcription repressor HrcA, partial [Acidobacteria bacterium]|nr:heat-inducible transcription repressor HrcA [Acidobacteriota bacterium]
MLTARRAAILSLVVQEYVQTAEPVASRVLAEHGGLDISAATIRNELARLEDDGYITHPHTSAGRVPSEFGYRTYVQSLMAEEPVAIEEQRTIQHQLHQVMGGLEEWLSLTATILASAVGNVAVVTSPRTATSRLRHLQWVELNPESALLVAVTDDGGLRQRIIPLRQPVAQAALQERTLRLNARLAGCDANEIRAAVSEFVDAEEHGTVRALAELVGDDRSAEETYLDGLSRALRQPEFMDPDRMLDAVARLQAYRLRRLVEAAVDAAPGETRVVIGHELGDDQMH